MSLRFSYKVGIFHVFFLVFSLQTRIGDTYNPFYFKKHSDFFLVWFISFSCPPAIQSRVEPFSEIACLV